MNTKRSILLLAAALLAAPQVCADILESEPNNTFATADPIARDPGFWSDAGVLSLGGTGGDLDFLSITLNAGESIAIHTTPLDDPPIHSDPDTILGLFDSGETLLLSDDDSGIGLGSALFFEVLVTGTYYIAITGFPDFDFEGDHTQSGRYLLSIKVIPAPGALAVLAGATLLARRRRRD